jgi:hypothetical protein
MGELFHVILGLTLMGAGAWMWFLFGSMDRKLRSAGTPNQVPELRSDDPAELRRKLEELTEQAYREAADPPPIPDLSGLRADVREQILSGMAATRDALSRLDAEQQGAVALVGLLSADSGSGAKVLREMRSMPLALVAIGAMALLAPVQYRSFVLIAGMVALWATLQLQAWRMKRRLDQGRRRWVDSAVRVSKLLEDRGKLLDAVWLLEEAEDERSEQARYWRDIRVGLKRHLDEQKAKPVETSDG